MNAIEFIDAHRHELSKYGGGELAFAEMVLTRVRSLDFRNVRHQLSFTDDRGKGRRIDFAIVEPAGVQIAIEVDSHDKTRTGTGMSQAEFDDFILRQNALTRQGWLLLRFTNAQVRHSPDECIRLIEESLHEQRTTAFASRHQQRANPRFYWPIVVATPFLILGFLRLPYEFYLVQRSQ